METAKIGLIEPKIAIPLIGIRLKNSLIFEFRDENESKSQKTYNISICREKIKLC